MVLIELVAFFLVDIFFDVTDFDFLALDVFLGAVTFFDLIFFFCGR